MRGGKGGYGPPLCKDYCLPEDVQVPPDAKARIALALYREATSVRSTPYEFLGYFKIIELCHGGKRGQIDWINRTIPLLSDRRAKERVGELGATQDIGDHLYGSGRCAVAHASVRRNVDPDSPDDVFRLSADMPVARALAEHLIEYELGIPWQSSQ